MSTNDLDHSGVCNKCGALGFSGDVHNKIDNGRFMRCGTFVAPPGPIFTPLAAQPMVNQWHLVRDETPSNVTIELVDQLLSRDSHGRAKYGVTLDRPDLTTSEWLQHMAEELMDGAGYALAAKRTHRAELLAIVRRCFARYVIKLTGDDGSCEQGASELVELIEAELSK